jgi:hypothetical protein
MTGFGSNSPQSFGNNDQEHPSGWSDRRGSAGSMTGFGSSSPPSASAPWGSNSQGARTSPPRGHQSGAVGQSKRGVRTDRDEYNDGPSAFGSNNLEGPGGFGSDSISPRSGRSGKSTRYASTSGDYNVGDEEEMIGQFSAITGANSEEARHHLSRTDWQLDDGVAAYLDEKQKNRQKELSRIASGRIENMFELIRIEKIGIENRLSEFEKNYQTDIN